MKDRLKKVRRMLDLTQEEFANKLGVTRHTVGQYEIGKNNPTNAVISLICREFDVNEEWLRTGEGEMFVELDREDILMKWIGDVLKDDESFKRRFVSVLASLDEKDWETLEKITIELTKENGNH